MAVKRFQTPFAIDPLTPEQVEEIITNGFKLIKVRDDGWEIRVDLINVTQVTCEVAYAPSTDHEMFQIAMIIDDVAHVYRWDDDGSLMFCRALSLEATGPVDDPDEYVEIEEPFDPTLASDEVAEA